MQPGIYDISNEEYHASEGISRSGILELKKSPLNYWDKYLSPEKEESAPTETMIIGTAVHTMLLEPASFYERFAVCAKVDGRTTEGKRYKAEFEIFAKGKQIINEENMETVKSIIDAIHAHPKVPKLIKDAKVEKSVYWNDKESGLLCKARPDIWSEELKLLCELKTANEAWPEQFSFSVRKFGYHIQAAMQIDGIEETTGTKIKDFLFIAAPTSKPYKPYIYMLPQEMIELGRQEYKAALKIAKVCIEKDRFDMDRDLVIPLDFSNWQLSNNSFHKITETYDARISA